MWIAAPVAAILIMTARWREIGTLATLGCLALAAAPPAIVSVTSSRRSGATGLGAASVFVASVGCVFAAAFFLARYWEFYHLGRLLSGILMTFVMLPVMLAVAAGLGAVVEARVRRRGLDEARAASLAIGAVVLSLSCLLALVVIESAPRRNAWEQGDRRALPPFFAALFGLGPRGEADCPDNTVLWDPCVLQLAYGAGDLRLAAGGRVGPLGSNDDGSQIVLEDSTVVEVWVTEYPAAGLSTTQGIGLDSLRRVDTIIAGRPAMLSTVKLSPPSATATYLGLGFITVDSVTAINFSVTTATPSSRDAALRFIARSIAPAG